MKRKNQRNIHIGNMGELESNGMEDIVVYSDNGDIYIEPKTPESSQIEGHIPLRIGRIYMDLEELTGELNGIVQCGQDVWTADWTGYLGKPNSIDDWNDEPFTAVKCFTPKETMALIRNEFDPEHKYIWNSWKLDNGVIVTVEY